MNVTRKQIVEAVEGLWRAVDSVGVGVGNRKLLRSEQRKEATDGGRVDCG